MVLAKSKCCVNTSLPAVDLSDLRQKYFVFILLDRKDEDLFLPIRISIILQSFVVECLRQHYYLSTSAMQN